MVSYGEFPRESVIYKTINGLIKSVMSVYLRRYFIRGKLLVFVGNPDWFNISIYSKFIICDLAKPKIKITQKTNTMF